MNKLIPLLAFSVLFVSVAVPQAFAGGPPFDDIGDFQCYQPIPPIQISGTGPIVTLTDQFVENIETEIVRMEEICFSGDKTIVSGPGTDSESPFGFGHHFTGWDIFTVNPPIGTVVTIENQFGTFENVLVEGANKLFVPASKDEGGGGFSFPPLFNQHWLCYDINIPHTGRVSFASQLPGIPYDVSDAELLCNPVEKTHNGITYPIINPDEHLTCYGISSGVETVFFFFNDQFIETLTTDPLGHFVDNGANKYLCLESNKILPNGNEDVIGGEIIPIESTSLILAGAQSFSWMIPVLLSGIGIGLFVVSRKNN